MRTREELEDELLEQILASDNSTLYPRSRLTSLIKNAYTWATQLVPWHDLVRAKETSTLATQENYDYPEEFKSESIQRLEIDSVKYKRVNFEDYLDFQRRNPNSDKKLFSSFGRQYFINPVPSMAGNNNISVWGSIEADDLDLSTSETIFSRNKSQGNDAVVRKALSVAVKRLDGGLATKEEESATVLLSRLFKLEQDGTQRNHRIDHPMMHVPDYFGGSVGGADPIASFNYFPIGDDY